jgi:hypothetical protein
MRPNPERVAWLVLLAAFFTLCFLAVSIPLGVRWYIHSAKVDREALVESVSGTVVVEPPLGRGPVPVGREQSLLASPGAVVRADENSEAVITFYDHSFMRLFPGAAVRIKALSSPRYRASELPNVIHLELLSGSVRIGTALSQETELDFAVDTLHAQALLQADGSYALEANHLRSEISSYRGQATVAALGVTLLLDARERTSVSLGQPPERATGIARNLIQNSDFSQPLADTWRLFNDQGADGGTVDGAAELTINEGRRAVRFVREGGEGNHCETILEQTLNQQLPDASTSLVVRAAVQVRHQSLSGGGYLSSEYPLMIRITYRDAYDSEAEWVQGFYIQNEAGTPTTYGLQIPEDRWYLYESGNLLETLPVRPYRLVRVRVYASGWDYDSLVSDINLIVE